MKAYEITGTCRKLGAIGKFEPFKVTVKADCIYNACERTRDIQSVQNEHVHIKDAREVWIKTTSWKGTVSEQECTEHGGAWTGSIPCTGEYKCIHCGKPLYQDLRSQ